MTHYECKFPMVAHCVAAYCFIPFCSVSLHQQSQMQVRDGVQTLTQKAFPRPI